MSRRWSALFHGEPAGLLLASALMVAASVLEVAAGRQVHFLSVVVVGPLVGAALVSPTATAWLGLTATALAVALGLPDQIFLTGGHGARVAVVAVLSALAWWVCRRRVAREEALARVTAIAEVAQQAILHEPARRLRGVRAVARYRSATAEARVGGDLYDVVESPYGVRALVGDVRGKGLPAVRLASVVLGSFREAAWTCPDLAGVGRALDAATRRYSGEEEFVTGLLVELGGRTVRVVSHGHPPPLLVRPGQVRTLAPEAVIAPLGLGGAGRASEWPVAPGDRLLLYTDGVVEARDPATKEFFDLHGAAPVLGSGSLEGAVDGLLAAVHAHTDGRTDDDVAVVLLEVVDDAT